MTQQEDKRPPYEPSLYGLTSLPLSAWPTVAEHTKANQPAPDPLLGCSGFLPDSWIGDEPNRTCPIPLPLPSDYASKRLPTTPREILFDLHERLCQKGLEVMYAKNHDYAQCNDPYRNFRLAENLGVSPLLGILIRMGDKLARAAGFAATGVLKVKDESIDDTLVDIINYTVLFSGMLKEEQEKQRKDVAVSVQSVLATPPGERVMSPTHGQQVRDLVTDEQGIIKLTRADILRLASQELDGKKPLADMAATFVFSDCYIQRLQEVERLEKATNSEAEQTRSRTSSGLVGFTRKLRQQPPPLERDESSFDPNV